MISKKALLPLCLALCSPVAASAQTGTQTPSSTRPRVVASPAPARPANQTPLRVSAAPSPTPVVVAPVIPSAPTLTNSPALPAGTITVTPMLAAPVVLQPIEPMSLDKIRARRQEAQRSLRSRVVQTALNPSHEWVTLAVVEPESSRVHTLTLPKTTFLKKDNELTLSSSLGTPLRLRILRPNYVNTAVVVSDLTGRQFYPMLLEYPIEKRGVFREMAYYTSAHPSLLSPELVRTGQAYVRTMLDLAAKRLKDKGIAVSPQLIDVAERLCLVEHVDHQRFRTENRRAVYEEVFALYALNELDTYKYSVSTAGAGGMVQMIPWTYQMIRRHYPAIGLNPDFVLGMRNHGNALEAMLLYMNMTWTDLASNPEVQAAMSAGWATQPDLMAAGYNSNPARLPLYIRRGGAAWRTLIPRETQMYLQIYQSVESLVPMKARESD
ncbi:MAG: hypothetical protein ACRD9R_07090 [Pyrinomonadaceae bacterium]